MATPVERQERRPAAEEITEVAPGVFRAQLPIALPGLGHVNCYLMEDGDGFAVVDPGMPDPASYAALQHRLAQVGATPERIHTVLVTHSHPDHFGGAGRLRVVAGADIVAHEQFRTLFDQADDDLHELLDAKAPVVEPDGFDPADFARYLLGDEDIPDLPARLTPWGGEMPFPPKEEILHMREWDERTKRGFLTPTPTTRIADGEVVRLARREWVAIHTPGHTGDHVCLFDPDDGTLLSGDHVLPTITPHISGLTHSPDSLAEFFAALERVGSLEGVGTVLPAHGDPFTDLPARTAAIRQHHEERLDLLREIGHQIGPATVVEFSHQLFQQRSWGAMAESETYAHLEHLRLAGEARRRSDGPAFLYDIAS
jgi:glyoxylase-like metal-dependent hydrolase (beta-lactamase superfamily II)